MTHFLCKYVLCLRLVVLTWFVHSCFYCCQKIKKNKLFFHMFYLLLFLSVTALLLSSHNSLTINQFLFSLFPVLFLLIKNFLFALFTFFSPRNYLFVFSLLFNFYLIILYMHSREISYVLCPAFRFVLLSYAHSCQSIQSFIC